MQEPEIIKPDGTLYTIYKYSKLDSTNTFLRRQCSTLPDYSVIWSEEQTNGRGRFDRVWDSEPGQDLTFSLLLPLTSLEQKLRQNITQTTALAVSYLLEDYGLKPCIKWPNDVLIQERKISGILCEMVESNQKTYGILGIGLNVNCMERTISRFDYPATSLCRELHHTVERFELFKVLLEIIIKSFKVLSQSGFSQSHLEIKKRLAFMNEQIVFADGKQNSYKGNIIDLNDDGTLLFNCDKRGIISLNSGEITFKYLHLKRANQ